MERYFVHDDRAGLSAFENAPASAAERGAAFFAVAILTPLDGSRLGRIWLHAKELQVLAVKLRSSLIESNAGSDEDAVPEAVQKELDGFWTSYHQAPPEGATDGPATPQPSKGRSRALTELGQPGISEYHPASSMISMLDSFGPLIFPLHRAALLRQSILLVQRPPLRSACDYVYLLSVLSNLPTSILDELDDVSTRLDPLFTVGTYDLSDLMSRSASVRAGEADAWIACTSDELLATKNDIYDVRVLFPGSTVTYGENSTWPSIMTRSGEPLRATQRDLRRYKALRRRLYKLVHDDSDESPPSEADDEALLRDASTEESEIEWVVPDESGVAEPLPWAAIAYDSFLWWASAGERSSEMREEDEHDGDLIHASFAGAAPETPVIMAASPGLRGQQQPVEMCVVTYFQRVTGAMLSTLLRVVAEDESATGEGGKTVVQRADLALMGLDGWSAEDRRFVQKLAVVYFGIDSEVQGATVECCGVRLL